MADTFLVVRTLDVNYAPLASSPTVAFDGGAAQPLASTPQPATFELKLPAGAKTLEVAVDEAGFWPVTQRLLLRPGPPPTLAWVGGQHVNARNLETHTRGSDHALVVNLVLGQLRDARATVDATLAAAGVRDLPAGNGATLPAQWVRDLGTPLLNKDGKGWDRLHQTPRRAQPGGKLFFVERQTTPKLVAVYLPPRTFQTTAVGEGPPSADKAVHYHITFHPNAAFMSRDYPADFQYPWLAVRYMVNKVDGRRVPGNQGKAMIAQQELSGKKPVFVFPIGSPVEYFKPFLKGPPMQRLLQELDYWLQRMDGLAFPAHTSGNVALSAFSFGAEALNTLFANLKKEPFPAFEARVKEVYGLDLHREDVNVPELCDRLRAWFKGGAEGRKLRVYSTRASGVWLKNLSRLEPGTTTSQGPSGTVEEQGPSSTVVQVTATGPFWSGIHKEATVDPARDSLDVVADGDFDALHHLMPAIFLEHALERSTFAD